MIVFNIYSSSQLLHAGVPIQEKLVIGRDPECDVVVAEPSVSRRHLSLRCERIGAREVVVLQDEGSRNGVHVNAQKVKERAVGPGDLIRFGGCRIDLQRVESRCLADNLARQETTYCRVDPRSLGGGSIGPLRALYSMALSLTDLEIPFMLEKGAEIVRTCIAFDELGLLLAGERNLILCTSWNQDGPCGREEIAVRWPVVQSCLKLGQPVVSPSGSVAQEEESGFAACVPLHAGGRVLGVLYCTMPEERPFTQDDVQFLTLVACHLAAGVSHRRNLADAQRAASRLEVVLGSLQEGVVVCDADLTVLSANQTARRIFNRERMVGRPFVELLEGFEHSFDAATIAARKSFEIERREPADGDGEPSLCAYRATVSSAAGLDADGWLRIICLHDVTRERTEEITQLAFVHRLAHKLRTPLTVLTTVSDLLVQEAGQEGGENTAELGSMMRESREEIARMIDRFVEFTSPMRHSPRCPSGSAPVALRLLIEQALSLAKDEMDRAELEFVDETSRPDIEIVGLPDRLVLCFLEIIENACKFAGRGARLTLRLREGEDFAIQFRDDGPGISERDLRRVFDLFHQVDREGTGETPGVGLGLWWTRRVVRAHGGEVRLSSPGGEDGGLCVEIALPRRRVVDPGGDSGSQAVEVRDSVDPTLDMGGALDAGPGAWPLGRA